MISKTSLKKDRWSCTRRYRRWSTVVMGGALALGATVQAAPPAANLDQTRNGSFDSPIDPPDWHNGNAGPQTAHFAESMSIGYRAILTNLPTDGTVITLILEYDIKHSDRHAIDYLTHFQRLEPHAGFLHAAETLDPRIGVPAVAGSPLLGDDTETIPAPSSAGSPVPGQPTQSYNDLVANEGPDSVVMTIYNGTFGGPIVYAGEGDLMASQSASSIAVSFTADDPTVVLAWGGHIASRNDWGFDADGVARSAGGIHGSPYHMRLIDWNLNNLGNQDRSLKAAAVFVPCPCEIIGPQEVCPLAGPLTYEGPIGADFTYLWEVIGDGNIVGANDQQTVMVQPKGVCGGSYTVVLTVTCGLGGPPTTCELPVDTVDNDMPTITCPPDISVQADANLGCATFVDPGTPTATDNCTAVGNIIIEGVRKDDPLLPLIGLYPSGDTIINWTATDECGNITQCQQVINVSDSNDLLLHIRLQPFVQGGPFIRGITLELSPDVGPDVIVCLDLAFTGGAFLGKVKIPCGDYTCITARDTLHTLRRTLTAADGFGIVNTQYVAAFIPAVGKELIGGNLNDDCFIDIRDFGKFIGQFGLVIGADTPCSTPQPHCDIDGNGVCFVEEFTFIAANFLRQSDPDCDGLPCVLAADGTPGRPISRISVRELYRLGMGDLAVADLNHDGWLDTLDMIAFMLGERP